MEHIEKPDFDELHREKIGPKTVFQSSLTRRLYQWWHDYSPSLPKRSQFDILEHLPIAEHIYLYRREAPGTFQYRLHGREVQILTGDRPLDLLFSIRDEIPIFSALAHYLEQVVSDGIAIRCHGTLRHLERQHIQFESVDLPLADEEGHISHVIGCITDLQVSGVKP